MDGGIRRGRDVKRVEEGPWEPQAKMNGSRGVVLADEGMVSEQIGKAIAGKPHLVIGHEHGNNSELDLDVLKKQKQGAAPLNIRLCCLLKGVEKGKREREGIGHKVLVVVFLFFFGGLMVVASRRRRQPSSGRGGIVVGRTTKKVMVVVGRWSLALLSAYTLRDGSLQSMMLRHILPYPSSSIFSHHSYSE